MAWTARSDAAKFGVWSALVLTACGEARAPATTVDAASAHVDSASAAADAGAPQVTDAAGGADSASADAGMVDAGLTDAADASPTSAAEDAAAVDSVGADTTAETANDGVNLVVQLSAKTGLAPGTVTLVAVDPQQAQSGAAGGGLPMFGNKPLFKGTVALPTTLSVQAEPGTWQFLAYVADPMGFPLGGGMACGAAGPAAVQIATGQVATVSIVMQPANGPSALSDLCPTAGPKTWTQVLTDVDTILTPPTSDGGAHFMQGLVQGGKLVIAGSQDGYVSFDWAGGALGGWKVHGGQLCNRLTADNGTLYCSSRNGYLHLAQMGGGGVSGVSKHWLSQAGGLNTEGLAVLGSHLYVAAHHQGLLRVSTNLGSAPLTIAPPGNAALWDVQPLDGQRLAVASDVGLHVFDSTLAGGTISPWVAALPLDGVAAFLHIDGPRVWVGDLTGKVRVADFSNPLQPKKIAEAQLPWQVFGVTVHQGLAYAAAGHHVVALELKHPTQGPLLVRAASPSPKFALDVDPWDAQTVVASEFEDVRRIHIEPSKVGGQAVLMAQPSVDVPAVAVGAAVAGVVRVYNASGTAAQVKELAWVESVDSVKTVAGGGPWSLPAGQLTTLPFSFVKTVKGATNHKLVLQTDVADQGLLSVELSETTWLHPGQTLPPMQYQDASGKLWDVQQHLQGKVGVVLAAAQSCPVAFMGLATAAKQLQPWLQSSQVAAIAINPWDSKQTAELTGLQLPFPSVLSGLTTKDGHDWSEVLNVTLGQPIPFGPPMPIVYVIAKDGTIAYAQWGYHPLVVAKVIGELLAKP